MYERTGCESGAITLAQVWTDYRRTRKLKPRTLVEYDNTLKRCFDDWLHRPIYSITKQDVAQRHHRITHSDGCPTQANQSMRILRAIFYFAINNYELDGKPVVALNPVKQLSALRVWNREKIRSNYIRPHEMEKWFSVVLKLENKLMRDFLLLLIFTGLRRTEALTLRWVDVDFRDRSFLIRDTKNGDDLALPMSDFVYALLSYRKSISSDEQIYVFRGRHVANHFDARSTACRIKGLDGLQFTYHDLRRSYLTTAEALDFSPYLIKQLANHRVSPTGDVTMRYIVRSTERLRKPMQQITNELLSQGKTGADTTRVLFAQDPA